MARATKAVYHDTLGRDVDSAGLAAWQTALESGWSRDRIAEGISNSLEADASLVDKTYQQFLSRQTDPNGLAAWVAALQQGLTEDRLIARVTTSAESLGSL